jgi:hypothetical protein
VELKKLGLDITLIQRGTNHFQMLAHLMLVNIYTVAQATKISLGRQIQGFIIAYDRLNVYSWNGALSRIIDRQVISCFFDDYHLSRSGQHQLKKQRNPPYTWMLTIIRS